MQAVQIKLFYAYGYERNTIIINGAPLDGFDATGIIKPGLYGLGIAFPEPYRTNEGKTVSLIGVNSFHWNEAKNLYLSGFQSKNQDYIFYCIGNSTFIKLHL